MPIKLVLYDWDGTIQDSMAEQYKGCVAVFKAANLEPPPCEYFCRCLTMPPNDWYRAHGVTTLSDEEMLKIFRSATNKENCPLFPGVRESLKSLKGCAIGTGIVSAGRPNIIEGLQAKHGLEGLFDITLCGIQDKAWGLSQACTLFGVEPNEAAYVGDLVSDVRDGQIAGLTTIAFLGPDGDEAHFVDHQPDLFVRSHGELLNALIG